MDSKLRLLTLCAFLFLASSMCEAALPAQDADVAPNLGPVATVASTDELWELVFSCNLTQSTGSDFLLGCEFAGGHWYVTDSQSIMPGENWVHILNPDGSLAATFQQPLTNGWGWRDIAYDGQYLYASAYDTIHAFDLDGNLIPSHHIVGPENPNRALAYDPVTDHFWTANWSDPLYEFDRDGLIVWQGSSGVASVYGAAWDDAAPDGPWLWLYSQTGSPRTTITKFDPINKVVTTESYNVPLIPGYTNQIAGGMCFTNEWDPDYWVFGCIGQAEPGDVLYCLEAYPTETLPEVEIRLMPFGSPVIIPASGGNFNYNISITNNTDTTQTCDLWIDVTLPDSSTFGPVLGPVNLTLPAAFSGHRRRSWGRSTSPFPRLSPATDAAHRPCRVARLLEFTPTTPMSASIPIPSGIATISTSRNSVQMERMDFQAGQTSVNGSGNRVIYESSL
ncbi:MAG: hypothetical protein JRI66_13365 [Deltaproteobacteria bacterium]|nr:hypothetical protein [Deltaproteobacteria bacterium]